jgi:hypothetical protein
MMPRDAHALLSGSAGWCTSSGSASIKGSLIKLRVGLKMRPPGQRHRHTARMGSFPSLATSHYKMRTRCPTYGRSGLKPARTCRLRLSCRTDAARRHRLGPLGDVAEFRRWPELRAKNEVSNQSARTYRFPVPEGHPYIDARVVQDFLPAGERCDTETVAVAFRDCPARLNRSAFSPAQGDAPDLMISHRAGWSGRRGISMPCVPCCCHAVGLSDQHDACAMRTCGSSALPLKKRASEVAQTGSGWTVSCASGACRVECSSTTGTAQRLARAWGRLLR